MDDFITTAEAARLAGVGVSSIKRWADQDRIRAIRTPGGHRRVARGDLMRFLDVARSGGETNQPASAAPQQAPDRSRGRVNRQPRSGVTLSPAQGQHLGMFWADQILACDLYELQALLLTSRGRLGSWHATADEAVLGLREIGQRWRRDEVTIMAEHVCSERLSRALAMIMETLPSTATDPTCLLACVEGDMHTLGLSFLQLCLRELNWNPLWVGASTPVEDLAAAARSGSVAMVALSASEASSDEAGLRKIVHELGDACRESNTLLALGGSGNWPDDLDSGLRFRSFSPFSAYVRGLR